MLCTIKGAFLFKPKQRSTKIFVSAIIMLLMIASLLGAQEVPIASPGDSPEYAGEMAHLSAQLSRRDVAKALKLFADWQSARMPAEPQTDWTWAALYAGFMAVPKQVAGDKYRRNMLKIGEQLNWRPGPRVMHADDQAVGQMFLEQYFIHRHYKMLEPMRARLDTELATSDQSDPKQPLWWWCDALFMAPPVYADMAEATGDNKYLTFMDHEWDRASSLLYDHSKHLYFRDASYLEKEEKNGQPLFWSRGNGWVMGGIVRVLK